MWLQSLALYFLVQTSIARPSNYDKQTTLKDDIASVESLRRDIREPAPLKYATEVKDLLSVGNAPNKNLDTKKRMKNASGKSDEGGFYKTYGSDADGEKGYLKETYSNGDHGYKTLDTFHKQDGDKYGFEKHIAYGKHRGGKKKGRNAESGSYSKNNGDHEGAGTIVDAHYAGDDAGHYDGDREYSRYTGNTDGDGYPDDYNAHYTDGEHELPSYDRNKSYLTGNASDGSYETHSSYTTGTNAEGDYADDR